MKNKLIEKQKFTFTTLRTICITTIYESPNRTEVQALNKEHPVYAIMLTT